MGASTLSLLISFIFFFFLKNDIVVFVVFNSFILLFMWLHWVFVAQSGATLNYGALASHYSRWFLLLWLTGSRLEGFSSCSEWTR